MKSQVTMYVKLLLISALIASAGVSVPASAQETSTWSRLTQTVKVKVQEWLGYWNGSPQPAAPAPTQNAGRPGATKPGTAAANGAPVNGATPAASATSAPAATSSATTPTPATEAATSATTSGTPARPTPVGAKSPVVPKPTKNELNAENQSLRQQKMFERDKGASLQEIQALRDALKKTPTVRVAQPARAGKSVLPKSKEGVPVTDFKRIRVGRIVPALDIGTEVLVSREDFGSEKLNFAVGRPSDLKKLASPALLSTQEFTKLVAQAVQPAYGAKGLQGNMRSVGEAVTLEKINKITYALKDAPEVKLLPYKPLSEELLKMVAALILFEKGNHCHMIMGLFHQLAENEKTRVEANYHLGACADSLKMDQVAFDRLSQVVAAEDKEFSAEALELLTKDLPLIYEKDFYSLLKNVKSYKNLITEKTQDMVAYRMAKGAYRAGDYKTSISYAGRVTSGTEYYDDARFLTAMNSFALNDKAQALKKLQELSASIEARKVQDKNIRALTAVNLARMYFAQKQYDKALEQYAQVPKDHALWVQALIEQGWTQLAVEDYAGAIGNMYSLHSPYFKAVYQPESFVVRTIGYLNICQYGDAYRTLSFLEKDYRDAFSNMSTYLGGAKATPVDIYGNVKTYIKGKSNDNVAGVPYQVWREMARRKDFLNLQTALNDKQDEARRYDGVNEKIKTEKASIRTYADQSKKRFDGLKAQMVKTAKDKGVAKAKDDYDKGLKRERDLTIAYRFQLMILEQSRQGFLDFQSKAQKKLDTETAGLTTTAGTRLIKHAKTIKEDLGRVLDNNEFLRYEVFSGSGENIRYQVAGGQVGAPNRIPASIKPQKMMNWNFDGEFWEDEIGSYRSSLQNVCPSNMHRTAKTAPDDQE